MKQEYYLNYNNEQNERDTKNVTISTFDTDTQELLSVNQYPMPLDGFVYLREKAEKGIFVVYRIFRFKPLLFQVEKLIFRVLKKQLVTKYETKEKHKKDLFEVDFDFFGVNTETDFCHMEFISQTMNVNEVGEIFLQNWQNLSDEKTFSIMFVRFLKISYGELITDLEKMDKSFYEKLKFH